jgi:hypothetical protein
MAIDSKLENVSVAFSLQSAAFTKALLREKKDILVKELAGITDPFEVTECQVSIRLCVELLEELKLAFISDLGVKAWETL